MVFTSMVNLGKITGKKVLAQKAVEMKYPTLRCAYYGYNGRMLKECSDKLMQTGRHPVKIHGLLVRKNLREEMDIIWLKINFIEIDGIMLNVAYGEGSNTMRNASKFYNWAEDLEK